MSTDICLFCLPKFYYMISLIDNSDVLVTPERPVPLLKGLKSHELCDLAQTVLHTYRILKNLKPDAAVQLGLQDGPFSGQTIKVCLCDVINTRLINLK